MIDQRPSDTDLEHDLETDIEQAPSPADIAAAGERVGRVDFTRRLGHRRARDLRVEPEERADAPERPERPERSSSSSSEAHLLVLPPAKVEAILAAETAKLEEEADAEAEAAEVEVVADPPVDRAPERVGSADRTPDLGVDQSVEDVAASIIASMRAIEENHHRHLEALEAEATRRYELLLAQAELDAELIRLNGRREAHRIIATARARTGSERGDARVESSRLQEIGETFTRFAETIESAAATPPPPHPDHGTT